MLVLCVLSLYIFSTLASTSYSHCRSSLLSLFSKYTNTWRKLIVLLYRRRVREIHCAEISRIKCKHFDAVFHETLNWNVFGSSRELIVGKLKGFQILFSDKTQKRMWCGDEIYIINLFFGLVFNFKWINYLHGGVMKFCFGF